jgi:hypothetical protein
MMVVDRLKLGTDSNRSPLGSVIWLLLVFEWIRGDRGVSEEIGAGGAGFCWVLLVSIGFCWLLWVTIGYYCVGWAGLCSQNGRYCDKNRKPDIITEPVC